MLAWSVLTSTLSLLICQSMPMPFQRYELCFHRSPFEVA
jgi:hypothetical protein